MRNLKYSILAILCGMAYLELNALIAEHDALIDADMCRPHSVNETAVSTIENGRIKCEKHQRLSFAQANQPSEQLMACPIRGACDLWTEETR